MPCLFCSFASGKRSASRGYPFLPVHETKRTVSFLSIDNPAHEEGHLLVIPKRHYGSLGAVPSQVLHELAEHVRRASVVLRKAHGGVNVLLNDGRAAGQYIPHVHVHVIPRDKGDGIAVEKWKRKRMSVKKFRKVTERVRKGFGITKTR